MWHIVSWEHGSLQQPDAAHAPIPVHLAASPAGARFSHVWCPSPQELQHLLRTAEQQKVALTLELCEVRDSLTAVCSAWASGLEGGSGRDLKRGIK